jgi:hypothetical protein
VRSVLLVSRVPLERIGTLGLDPASRTSNALAEVLLRERFGVAPSAEECAGTPEEVLRVTKDEAGDVTASPMKLSAGERPGAKPPASRAPQ